LLPQFGLLSTVLRGTITSARDIDGASSTPLVEIGDGRVLALPTSIDARRFREALAADWREDDSSA